MTMATGHRSLLQRAGDWALPMLMAVTVGMMVFLIDRAADDRDASRLERGAEAYCEADDAERAAIDRKLRYRLPEAVRVEVRCLP